MEERLPAVDAIEATIAKNVKRWRENSGWTQADLAKRLTDMGVPAMHQATVARIESAKGDRRPLRLVEALALAQVFEADLSALVESPYGGWVRTQLRTLSAAKRTFGEAVQVLVAERHRLAMELDHRIPADEDGWGDAASAYVEGVSGSILSMAEDLLGSSDPVAVMHWELVREGERLTRTFSSRKEGDQPPGNRERELLRELRENISLLEGEEQDGEHQEAP